jgi:hypothetical protein
MMGQSLKIEKVGSLICEGHMIWERSIGYNKYIRFGTLRLVRTIRSPHIAQVVTFPDEIELFYPFFKSSVNSADA